MREGVAAIAEFSDAVGAIYDCALDPKQWPRAIRAVCAATRCEAGIIGVHDLDVLTSRIQEHWNYQPEWLAKIEECAEELAELWNSVDDLHSRPIDEPLTAMRDIAEHVPKSRYFQEWALPLGFIDTMQLTPLRQPRRLGAFGLWRHRRVGAIDERDLAIMRLLAPHIRRAVAISDVLNMQAIKIETLQSSLDLLKAGIVLVDGEAKLVHANKAAEVMLKAGSPISARRGEIRTRSAEASAALKAAVATAASDEAAIGAAGIGLPAPQTDGSPALIHVLPLASGDRRARIAPRASAALFVTTVNHGALPAQSLAALFDLTLAETRVLEGLLIGRTLSETAKTNAIALSTARTHMAKIFSKTGVSRQAELVRLAAQFAPPALSAPGG
jgi:DNA-binding CsgD family transcriptional regulator/PAS domain-containing protein